MHVAPEASSMPQKVDFTTNKPLLDRIDTVRKNLGIPTRINK